MCASCLNLAIYFVYVTSILNQGDRAEIAFTWTGRFDLLSVVERKCPIANAKSPAQLGLLASKHHEEEFNQRQAKGTISCVVEVWNFIANWNLDKLNLKYFSRWVINHTHHTKENNPRPVRLPRQCTSSQSHYQLQSKHPSLNRRPFNRSIPYLDENWWIRTNEVRFVRFLLSPPPEESMADRPVRERTQTVFYTTDPKAEEESFGEANEWGRKQLKMLGVQFVPNAKKRLDLNKVLNIDEKQWPPKIQKRM